MSRKTTRTLRFAEEMARACLPYADRRRVGGVYPIEMVDVLENSGEGINREVKLLIYPLGRDCLIATCRYLTYHDSDWVGTCQLETETGDYAIAYQCSISGDGKRVDVVPLSGGPGSRYTCLPQPEMHAFLDRLPLLRGRFVWDIWPIVADAAAADADSDERRYGAWRMSWVIGECLQGPMNELALAIAKYELAHCRPDGGVLSKKWRETVVKLSPLTA